MPPPPFAVWSEILAADNGLTLTSFAVGGATMNTLPGTPTVDAGYELTVFDSVNPVITQPAAAVVQLGSNGEGRAGACLGKGCLGGPACLGGPDHRHTYNVPHFLTPHAQISSTWPRPPGPPTSPQSPPTSPSS